MHNKQYRNFIVVIALSISLICGNASAWQAQAAPCVPNDIDQLCNSEGYTTPTYGTQNRSVPLDQPRPPNPAPNPAPYSLTPITTDDIEIKYRYSDPNGIGQEQELVKNATLYTGDLFTIHITPKRAMYLYIFHFYSTGKVMELMDYSKRNNYITPGPAFILPANDEHFYLDDTVGTEHIHAIVSPYPLPDLILRYQQSRLTVQPGLTAQPRLTAQELQDGKKGIGVRRNRNQPAPSADPNSCLAGEACRDTMVIQHLGR